MDPLTALGLASAVVQFVDFGFKLVKGTSEIYDSATDAAPQDASLEFVTQKLQELTSNLEAGAGSPHNPDQSRLQALAEECQSLSAKILALLAKTKAKNRSLRASAGAAIRTWRYREEKKEIETRLERCQSKLAIQLNALMRSETKDKLERLIRFENANARDFASLYRGIEELRQGVHVASFDKGIQEQLKGLLGLSVQAFDSIRQERVLRALFFDDMHQRVDGVKEAHQKTFEWILGGSRRDPLSLSDTEPSWKSDGYPLGESMDNEEHTTSENIEATVESDKEESHDDEPIPELPLQPTHEGETESPQSDADAAEGSRPDEYRNNHKGSIFMDWLSHSAGIFHIAGKPGSGKSTLMKFLCDDSRTTKCLQAWRGNKELVFASFFFWRYGVELQKSLHGLFRGLLYDSLKQCPELIPEVFPSLWKSLDSPSMLWHNSADLTIRREEIREAFQRMIKHAGLYNKRCFCFFIDGLDEYEETDREGYIYLVDLLFEWVRTAPECVKLCVSSRELNSFNPFERYFSSRQKLRLQELTRKDIETVAKDRLSLLQSDCRVKNSDCENLIHLVVAKADGVFLWVNLVLKTLEDGVQNGDSFGQLIDKVKSLPYDLNKLFRSLLDAIDLADRPRAYRMIAVAKMLNSNDCEMSLYFYSFLEDYYDCPTFALNVGLAVLNQAEIDQRVKRARLRVNAYSKGLLETIQSTNRWISSACTDTQDAVVSFTHRSVCDFLEEPDVRKIIAEENKHFHVENAICECIVGCVRRIPLSNAGPMLKLNELNLISTLESAISVFKVNWRDDRSPYLLDHMDASIRRLCRKVVARGGREFGFHANQLFVIWEPHIAFERSALSFYSSAKVGLFEYVEWKKLNGVTLHDDRKASILFKSCLWNWIDDGNPKAMETMEWIMDSYLPPNRPISRNEGDRTDQARGLTLWILVFALWCDLSFGSFFGSANRVADVVEACLKRGAEPRIWVTIRAIDSFSDPPEPPASYEIESILTEGGTRYPVDFSDVSIQDEATVRFFLQHMKASFQDVVSFWAPPNAERLQAMIDAELKSSKGTSGGIKHDDHFCETTDSTGIENTKGETEQFDQMELHSVQEHLVWESLVHRVWESNWVWTMIISVLGVLFTIALQQDGSLIGHQNVAADARS